MLAEKDIDETMAADWAAIREKHAVEEPEVIEPEVETSAPEPEIPVEPVRARDDSGKFVKGEDKPNGLGKQTQAQRSEKVPTEAPSKSSTASGKTSAENAGAADRGPVQDVNARDVSRAPSSWKPAARAEYEKLPPDSPLRAEIHRREADMSAGAQQLLPDATLGKEMRAAIEPYRMLIEAEGGTPARAVADLMRTAAIFRVGTPEQKYQAVAGIARQYGLDLRVFSQQGQPNPNPQPQPAQFRDPRVDQMLAHQQQQERDRQARETQEMEQTVTAWMNEVKDGKSSHPYINDVFADMSALIPQIREAQPGLTKAQALEEAYNRAVWAHPEIRTLLQQQAASDLEAQRRADNQTRVRDARRAASVNVPRRASTPSPGKPGTLEETIASTARELGLIT